MGSYKLPHLNGENKLKGLCLMSRTKKFHRSVYWKVAINESVALQVGLLLTNPLTGNIRKDSRGELITSLLRDWVTSQAPKEDLTTQSPHDTTIPSNETKEP